MIFLVFYRKKTLSVNFEHTIFGVLCFFLAKQIEVMPGAGQSRSSRLVLYVDMDFGTKDDVFFPTQLMVFVV